MSGEYFQSDRFRLKDERMHTVWSIMPRTDAEMREGSHPTQKPVALLRRIVLASTRPGDTIFDPFNGGGTTGIAVASIGKRKYIGCDQSKEYIDLTVRRFEAIANKNEIYKKNDENLRESRKTQLSQMRNKSKGLTLSYEKGFKN